MIAPSERARETAVEPPEATTSAASEPPDDEFDLIERYFGAGRKGAATAPGTPSTAAASAPGTAAASTAGNGTGTILGIGDDAAVIATGGVAENAAGGAASSATAIAVAVDTIVAGVHFPHHLGGDAVGRRVLAVNLSDFAAMGAQPRWCTLALTLPAADPSWLAAFAEGFLALAESHGVELVGGDTTRGPLTVTVQLLGDVDGDRILRRSGAAAGDDIYVTGTLGDAAAGLHLLAGEDPAGDAARGGAAHGDAGHGGAVHGDAARCAVAGSAGVRNTSAAHGRAAKDDTVHDSAAGIADMRHAEAPHGGTAHGDTAHQRLRQRFLEPEPRVAAGLALRRLASAAIDVSDGLLADLGHLCRASGCGGSIDLERLPVSAAARELFPAQVLENWALSGGDDYELCFTAPPRQRRAVRQALQACATPVRRIGRLDAGRGVRCRRAGRPVSAPARPGYTHFPPGSGAGAAGQPGRE